MRSVLTGLLLVFGLSVVCSCSKTAQLPGLSADAVVLAFGDSITFGTGAAPAESYPSLLEKRIGRPVVNAGVPGEVTAQGRARLSSVLDENRPALLLLCLGGNDFLQRLDDARTAENLKAMISLARERGVAVVLIAVPRLGMGLEVPKFYKELAREFALPLEDRALKAVLAKNSLKSDLIHPNGAGYAVLAEAVAVLLHDSGAL